VKITTRNVLLFSLVAEGATGLVVVLAPGLVAQLLFGLDVTGAGVAFGRLLGVTLLTLVLACWPDAVAPGGTRAALRAVLAYNALAAAYLAYLGIAHHPMGILLWPAVAEHALVAALLGARARRAGPSAAGRP
jgi:hypothetical protein